MITGGRFRDQAWRAFQDLRGASSTTPRAMSSDPPSEPATKPFRFGFHTVSGFVRRRFNTPPPADAPPAAPLLSSLAVSYTHLTLPTIYSV